MPRCPGRLRSPRRMRLGSVAEQCKGETLKRFGNLRLLRRLSNLVAVPPRF